MFQNLIYYIFLISVLLCKVASSQSTLIIKNEYNINIASKIEYIEDTEKNKTLQYFINNKQPINYKHCTETDLNFGYANANYWVKLNVLDVSGFNRQYYLFIDNPLVDSIDLYYVINNKIIFIKKAGDLYNFNQREVEDNAFLFNLDIPKLKPVTIYFHFRGNDNKLFPIHIIEKEYYHNLNNKKNILDGIFLGILIAMIIYNAFLSISLRDKNQYYYVLFMFSVLMVIVCLNGTGYRYIFIFNKYFANISNLFFIGCAALFCSRFIRRVFEMQTISKPINYLLSVHEKISGVLIILSIISIFTQQIFIYVVILAAFITITTCINIIISGILGIYKKLRFAYFFSFGWFFLILGVFAYILRNIGILPTTIYTNYSIQAGLGIQAILLSFGLADRIRQIQKSEIKSQTELLDAIEFKRHTIEEQNELLEQKVIERIKDIEIQKEAIIVQSERINRINKELEQKNLNITDSIRYASIIQSGMLPNYEILSSFFKDYFLIFKPRDIVSGDFYQVKQRRGYWIIAVADCTGHGVPGAFLSMLGIASLNEILSQLNFALLTDKASEVLELMRGRIKSVLNQTSTTGLSRDGIDMSICVFDPATRMLHFSGAYSNLYILKNGDLIEYKGTACPIGYHNKERKFENIIIEIDKGDKIYLFTDGIVDQMGGEPEKPLKFNNSRMREMLESFNNIGFEQQKQIILSSFENWKGTENDQIDDILILGFVF